MKWPWITRKEVADGIIKAALSDLELSKEVIHLREKKQSLEAQVATMQEKMERTTREIEHKVGLHKLQVTTETDLASRKAILDVQQENLKVDRQRFEENLKFTRDQMNGQLEGMKEILTSIIARLPEEKISTKTQITRRR